MVRILTVLVALSFILPGCAADETDIWGDYEPALEGTHEVPQNEVPGLEVAEYQPTLLNTPNVADLALMDLDLTSAADLDVQLYSAALQGDVGSMFDLDDTAQIRTWVGNFATEDYVIAVHNEEGVAMAVLTIYGTMEDLVAAAMRGDSRIDNLIAIQGCSGDDEDDLDYDEPADDVVVAAQADGGVMHIAIEAHFVAKNGFPASTLRTTLDVQVDAQ